MHAASRAAANRQLELEEAAVENASAYSMSPTFNAMWLKPTTSGLAD
jgi:hypothetical protein